MPSLNRLLSAERSPIERVRIYTYGSLYVLFVFFMGLNLVTAVRSVSPTSRDVLAVALTVLLSVGGLMSLRALLEPDPPPRPGVPALVLLGVGAVGVGLLATRVPADGAFALTLIVICAAAWSLGGFPGQRAWQAVVAFSGLAGWLSSRDVGLTAYAAGLAAFLVFTVRSSLWLLGVVGELEVARRTSAALAVAEERLRFSRDVHDVLGRRLSEIAVQAELAGAYVARNDDRAAGSLGDVRATAHTALREARELARGYRPVDLTHELEGARALLGSAGIHTSIALDALPPDWHEPVARVVREAVTNVLRHSRATQVTLGQADGVVTIRNDGSLAGSGVPGHGLQGLGEAVAPLCARIETQRDGEWFELRVVPGEGGR